MLTLEIIRVLDSIKIEAIVRRRKGNEGQAIVSLAFNNHNILLKKQFEMEIFIRNEESFFYFDSVELYTNPVDRNQ